MRHTISSIAISGPFVAGKAGVIDMEAQTLNAATDDTERTVVLAHMLAHQLDGDQAKRSGVSAATKTLGLVSVLSHHVGMLGAHIGVLGLAAGVISRHGDEERADAMSLTLAHNVGIAPERVLAFWVRYADLPQQNLLQQLLAAHHPMHAKRMNALRGLVAQAAPTLPTATLTTGVSMVAVAMQASSNP